MRQRNGIWTRRTHAGDGLWQRAMVFNKYHGDFFLLFSPKATYSVLLLQYVNPTGNATAKVSETINDNSNNNNTTKNVSEGLNAFGSAESLYFSIETAAPDGVGIVQYVQSHFRYDNNNNILSVCTAMNGEKCFVSIIIMCGLSLSIFSL